MFWLAVADPLDPGGIMQLRITQWASVWFSAGVVRRSLRVAFVVGTVLNLINQGEAFVGLLWGSAAGFDLDWFRGGLNFLVPYTVSSYGGTSAILATMPAHLVAEDAPQAAVRATVSPMA